MATRLYEILDDLILEDGEHFVSIDKLLNPQQKYDLIMSILNGLPITDFKNVLEFNTKFKVKKEKTHIIEDFKQKELRFNLIIEEAIELGRALGFDIHQRHILLMKMNLKIANKNIEPSLTEVLDALTDLLYVTYGAIDVFNLTDSQYEAMQEVHISNMSKLIKKDENSLNTIKETVKKYKKKGIQVITKDLKNEYIAICDINTDKVLKPITYVKPDLKTIIYKHLKI